MSILKPSDVLISNDGRVFLADFGIASFDAASTVLTQTGMVVGTPMYMAPEVAAGDAARQASDRYSLAVMAFEMLAGQPPFSGENVLSILHQHTSKQVPAISETGVGLPLGLDPIFVRGLAKQPEARFHSCQELVESLRGELKSLSRESSFETERTLELTSPPAEKADRRAALVVGFLSILIVATMVGLHVWTPEETRQTEQVAIDARRETTPEERHEVLTSSESESHSEREQTEGRTAEVPVTETRSPETASEVPPSIRDEEPKKKSFDLEDVLLFRARSSREIFERMSTGIGAGSSQRRVGPRASRGDLLRRYAEGGLWFLNGDVQQARSRLRSLLSDKQAQQGWTLLPLIVLRSRPEALSSDWAVAFAYGDPLQQAAGQLDQELDHGLATPDRLLARACLYRLDQEPGEVIELLSALQPETRLTNSGLAAFIAILIGDAQLAMGDSAGAEGTWNSAIDQASGNSSLQRALALYFTRSLARLDQPALRERLLRKLCESGQEPACRALRGSVRSGSQPNW